LHVLAARCETAAGALSAPPVPVGGPPEQATTVAVTEAHQLVAAVLAAFATDSTDAAGVVRTVAANYTDTDKDSGHNLAAVGQSITG
jgi:hypothetical protein